MKRSPKLVLLLLGLSAALAAFGTGCYTLLKHPAVEYEAPPEAEGADYDYEYEPIAVQWRDDCVSCHTGAEVYYNPTSPFNYYYNHGYDRWIWYYDLPWWADEAGYYPEEEDSGGLPNPRRFGRRGRSGRSAPEVAPPAASNPPPSSGGVMSKRGAGEQSVKKGDSNETKRQPKQRKTDTKKKRRTRKKSG